MMPTINKNKQASDCRAIVAAGFIPARLADKAMLRRESAVNVAAASRKKGI